MNELREGLKVEICFWSQLIEDSLLASESLEIQRMENALSLARRRLAECEKSMITTAPEAIEH